MKNEIRFTLESKQRPKLAQEIGNILGTVPHYERVPSCAYDIAGYRLDKEGVLHIPEGAEETTKDLIRQLRERGFQDDAEVTEEVPVQEDKLTIGIPRESLTDTALENLQKIIANKQTLFQRAFWMDSTEIEITDEKINFTWFPYTVDGDEIAAYTQFISRLCDMARDAKRVSSKPTETDNDKYAFRCFLLRLGFIGKEYKTARKILLKDKLTIGIPRESLTDTALENLQKIIANKQTLFQRAFWMDSTEIEITDEKINFTWFPYTVDGDEIAAYTQFISRLCDMARDAKRVSSKPTETDNDKYAFRCFLLRLGFIGKEYKTARKILLRNLTGNSASRYGE